MLLPFMDHDKFEGRVIPLRFLVYLYKRSCYIRPDVAFFHLRDGKFNEIQQEETRDLANHRPNHFTGVINNFSHQLAYHNKLLFSPVSEMHLRRVMSE